MSSVRVVNIIPAERSDESNLDWQPSIAVNPANTNEIVIVALTPPEIATENWPIFFSNDRGESWQMNFNLPGELWDQSVGLCTSGQLFRAIATGATVGPGGVAMPLSSPEMYLVRTPDPSAAGPLPALDPRTGIDQPYLDALTDGGTTLATDRLYVGYNDRSHMPKTATVDVCLDARAAAPMFKQVRLDPRAPTPMDGYEVRPAAHSDGTVYVAYKGWRSWDGATVTTDIVVARDDNWGTGGFKDLKDPDGHAGRLVATGVKILDPQYLSGQRLDNDLAIAVDPINSGTLYIVWGDNVGPIYTLRVYRSFDSGNSWSGELFTVENANLACLAINIDGRVGFMYQQLVSGKWETHFRRTIDGSGKNWDDIVLARTSTAGLLADYSRLISVGKDFYGVFPAWNTPDPTNFPATPATALTPNGAKYLRNATQVAPWELRGSANQFIQGSIDPFFYIVYEEGAPAPPTNLQGSPH